MAVQLSAEIDVEDQKREANEQLEALLLEGIQSGDP